MGVVAPREEEVREELTFGFLSPSVDGCRLFLAGMGFWSCTVCWTNREGTWKTG
jgi:hypothetical protein